MLASTHGLVRQTILVPAFFLLFFVVGLLAFPGYGISWDEPNQVKVAEYAYSYVFEGQPWPTEAGKRYYGTSFELPAATLGHLLGLETTRSMYLFRHFLNFLYFFVGVFFFYKLAAFHFKSWQWGLLGALFLILSPRIFADGFYNSKDLISMCFFIIAFYTLVRFLEQKNWKRLLLHAFATALALTIRLTALVIPVFTILFLGIHALQEWRQGEGTAKKRIVMLVAYGVTVDILTILLWPFLWEQPVAHFLEAYRFMSTLAIDTFYMGEAITQLPWHYIFVWIGISTPLLYSLFFLMGLGANVTQIVRNPLKWIHKNSASALYLLWFFLPIIAVYITGSGIFDGWRHMYFVYGAFLMIALQGLYFLWEKAKSIHTYGRRALAGIITIASLSTMVWMVRNHPLQNVYFSLPSSAVEHNFELDYWGLSYRPAIEWILANDPDPQVVIAANSNPGYSVQLILPKEQHDRVLFDDVKFTEYYLDNYRFRHRDSPPNYPQVHAIYVDGIKVIGIYINPNFSL